MITYSFIKQYNQIKLWQNLINSKLLQNIIAQLFSVIILSCLLLNIAQSSSESNSIDEQCLIPI
jgi:hypothetical protein